jgi:hypothetical protein
MSFCIISWRKYPTWRKQRNRWNSDNKEQCIFYKKETVTKLSSCTFSFRFLRLAHIVSMESDIDHELRVQNWGLLKLCFIFNFFFDLSVYLVVRKKYRKGVWDERKNREIKKGELCLIVKMTKISYNMCIRFILCYFILTKLID